MTRRALLDLYRDFLGIYLRQGARKAVGLLIIFCAAIALDLWLPAILGRFIDQALDKETVASLIPPFS